MFELDAVLLKELSRDPGWWRHDVRNKKNSPSNCRIIINLSVNKGSETQISHGNGTGNEVYWWRSGGNKEGVCCSLHLKKSLPSKSAILRLVPWTNKEATATCFVWKLFQSGFHCLGLGPGIKARCLKSDWNDMFLVAPARNCPLSPGSFMTGQMISRIFNRFPQRLTNLIDSELCLHAFSVMVDRRRVWGWSFLTLPFHSCRPISN